LVRNGSEGSPIRSFPFVPLIEVGNSLWPVKTFFLAAIVINIEEK